MWRQYAELVAADFCVTYLNGHRDPESSHGNRGHARSNLVLRTGRNETKGTTFRKAKSCLQIDP